MVTSLAVSTNLNQQQVGGTGLPRVKACAFTLLEVVISLAIFFIAAAALSQLVLVGVRSARWAELVSEGTLRCESELAALTSGLKPLESTGPVEFSDNPDWTYEVDVAPTGVPNLVRVTVTVRHYRTEDREQADVEVSLAQLVATEQAGSTSEQPAVAGSAEEPATTTLLPGVATPYQP